MKSVKSEQQLEDRATLESDLSARLLRGKSEPLLKLSVAKGRTQTPQPEVSQPQIAAPIPYPY